MPPQTDGDPLERGLRQKLLARTREDLAAMRAAAQAQDFPIVVRLSHRLAGAAGALGLDALSHAARELERDGEKGDAPQVRSRLDAVAAELDRVIALPAH
jgi:HPt (histidine-containing phosphotransfer) domain-containing protein